MKKIKEALWQLAFVGLIVGLFSIPVLAVYARVSECGWKSLFVECRITSPAPQ